MDGTDNDSLLLLIQDLLRQSEKLATERDVYRQIVNARSDLKQAADDYLASPEYAAKLQRYIAVRNQVVAALRQSNLDEFARSLALHVNLLNPIHIASENTELES